MEYIEKYRQYLEFVEITMAKAINVKQPQELYEPMRYLIHAGGKRIRPVLCMIASGSVDGEPEKAVNIAAAIEILHNFTLVHDDIMDNSPLRRGRPTVHEKWNESVGILTGDVMIGWGYKLLPDLSENPWAGRIVKEYTKAIIEVCEGQAYDMRFNEIKDITMDDYIMMIEKKTARLLECSAVCGAIAGGGNDEEIENLRDFANHLGLAFQIQDDLLDMTANQNELGKKIGQDILEGKKTGLIIKAKELATEIEDTRLLDLFFEKNGLGEEYINKFKEMFERLGVFDYAIETANEHFDKAREFLDKLNENYHTDMLRWLVSRIDKRSY